MKLSVAISAYDAPPGAFVVWRGIQESICKASQMGYDGVELALREAGEINPSTLSRWLSDAHIQVSAISTGQVFAVSGLTFTDPTPDARTQIRKTFFDLIDLAADFAPIINVGRARGSIQSGQTIREATELFTQSIDPVLEYAAQKNVTIIIEPVNRYEINFVNNLDEGLDLLAAVKYANLGLMPDVFHMNIEDDYIGKSLIRAGSAVRYIHLADSNRLAPGQGHIDFDEVFSALSEIGFDGWASVEILPLPDPDTAAREAAAYLRPRIRAYRPKGGNV